MSAFCLVFLLLPVISAQTFNWGPCPNPSVQPNFHIKKYMGDWYEIERLPASFERGKCIEANYALRKDGTIRVVNSQFYKDKVRTAEGIAVVRNKWKPAKLGVKFSHFSPYSPYWVLNTDYTTLSVVYSCTDVFHLFHVDYAWILSRSRTLPAAKVRMAKDLLVKEGIDISRMKPTNQNKCNDM